MTDHTPTPPDDLVARLRSAYSRPRAGAALALAAADEIERLRRWQNGALVVLAAWDAVWTAAGEPGSLGDSKAKATEDYVRYLVKEYNR